jgi:hypothetical protein
VELGITATILVQLALSGDCQCIDHPHIAVAGMTFKYFALAGFNWANSGSIYNDE